MNPDDPTPLDEQCASLLADCHEALLAGKTGPDIPRALRLRLERDLACVRMLDQARSPGPEFAPVADAQSPSQVNSETNSNELPATIGRFQIRRELGRGGYGVVFQAYDPQLGREIALKVPRAEAVLSPELRQRFLREARAAAVLDHPNVVPVYDAGEVGPVCYIVSAYCPGSTLDAWLRARAEPVPWQEAAALLATLAEAVHHAHAHGVIHRDLKPSNILLTGVRNQQSGVSNSPNAWGSLLTPDPWPLTPVPKITDFGLAKLQAAEAGTSVPGFPTQSGALIGTPRYMAPEQTLGRSKAIGPAVDIHALGAILYEVLTSRPPFVAETVLDTLEQVRSHEPLPPSRLRPKLPRDVETICLKCLQKEPRKRYASALELAQDLRRFLHGEPIQARAVGAWERAARWAKRRPAVATLLALVVGITMLGLVLVVWQWQAAITARRITEENLYFHSIALAERELFLQNWGPAEDLLEEQCEEARRGWEWYYLKRLRQAPPIVLPLGEHSWMGEGFDLAFHPDNRLLAIPRGDGTIRIWDVATGREVLTLRGHTGPVLGVAFSPDGRRLASTSEDGTVRVWDAETGQELLNLKRHTDRVIGVAFSPDQGRLLASASNDGTVKLWNATSGELLFDLPGQSILNPHVHLAFSPDGQRLASGSLDNTVKVWDVMTGKGVYTLSGHEQPILNVTFSRDGHRIVSAGRDRVVNVWDLPSGEPGAPAPGGRVLVPGFTLPNRTRAVWGMALSLDGQRLAVGGPFSDGNVRVYDMTTRQLLLPPSWATRAFSA